LSLLPPLNRVSRRMSASSAAACFDIGGGTTELVGYTGGVVRHTAAIPVGGDHFTNDLAVGLRTPIPEAEQVKREHACVFRELMPEDFAIEIASVGDRPPRTVFTRMLFEIVEPARERAADTHPRRNAPWRSRIANSRRYRAYGRRRASSRARRAVRERIQSSGACGIATRTRGDERTGFPARVFDGCGAVALRGAHASPRRSEAHGLGW